MSKLKWSNTLPALAILLHLGLLIYLKYTAWPEMSLWPYLMAKGWLPYRDIAIAHTPLMLTLLAIFNKIAGTGIIQLKLFTWAVILGLDFLVYFLVKKIWNIRVALLSLIAFIFLQIFYDGNGLWFDLFMGVFAFVSFFFVSKKHYFWAGIFLALAFISKQTAVWFAVPIGLELLPGTKKIQNAKKFVAGAATILVLFVLMLIGIGILPDFYHWAINFGIFVLPRASGQMQLPDIKNLIVSIFPFLIFIPLIWATKKKNLNLVYWAIAGAFGTYPRFEYFHFQPALPFLAVAVALVFSGNRKEKMIKIFTALYLLGALYLFSNYFIRNFNEGVRFYEVDVVDIAGYVKSNTNSGDTIFVMNWWDNVYAISGTLPATDPWVPQLPWYQEIPGIQEKEVSDLASSKPKMILLNPYSETGLAAYVPQKVYDYVSANYKIVHKVDGVEILVVK